MRFELRSTTFSIHFLDAEFGDTSKMSIDGRINTRAEVEDTQESAFDITNGIKRLCGNSEAGKSTSKELLRQ